MSYRCAEAGLTTLVVGSESPRGASIRQADFAGSRN